MESDALKIIDIFVRWLHPSVREAVSRRFSAMVREFCYFSANNSEDLKYLRTKKKWSDHRFYVLFALNSIYQIAIGPHQASARTASGQAISGLYVKRGATGFGNKRKKNVNVMVEDFMAMVSKLGFNRSWLSLNTCGDLIYWISRHERDEDVFDGSSINE